jgi:uncharacterized protein YfaS (alpha-2-macroglobulin family)
MKRSIIFLLITVSFVSFCQRKGPAGAAADERLRIEVSVDKLRPEPGETIQVSAIVKTADSIDDVNLRAKILVPTKGGKEPQDLSLTLAGRELGLFKGEVRIEADARQGFYGVTVASEDPSRPAEPAHFFAIFSY